MDARRRSLLTLNAAAAVGLVTPNVAATRRLDFDGEPFALGVASGSPRPDGVVLWTRVTGRQRQPTGDVAVRWEVWPDDLPRRVVASGTAVASAEADHCVHVEVDGLEADRWYGYRFTIGAASSREGRTRTLPAPASLPSRLRLAFASCQRWEHGRYAAYRRMLEDAPDMVLFLGDYIYEQDGRRVANAVRMHGLPTAENLAGYRARYALYRSDPALQAMHAACPWSVVWDDHEVQNNYAGAEGSRADAMRRMAAYRAFYDYMPLPRSALAGGIDRLGQGGALRIHERITWGRLLQAHMLDARQHRTRAPCASRDASARADCRGSEAARYSALGREQSEWLADGLQRSASTRTIWNLIGVPSRLTPANYRRGAGRTRSADGWDAHPEARLDLLRTIRRSGTANPVIVSGDVHHTWVAHVHEDPYDVSSPVVAAEFCGTSITSRSNLSLEVMQRYAAQNPHCVFADSRYRGYGLIDASASTITVSFRTLEDATAPDGAARTLAAFRLLAGRSRIEVL